MAENKDKSSEPPAPEELKPQTAKHSDDGAAPKEAPKAPVRLRRTTYRPSHKATFVGLAVVVAILAVNAGVIAFFMKSQTVNNAQTNRDEVTLSPAALDKLGVSRNPVGDAGTELIVGPDARFNGKVTIAGDAMIAGQLKLNSKFSASDASLTNLQAGKTAVSELNVNGDATVSNLNLRKDLTVVGVTRLQGLVTMSQLLTVNNNLNVAGSLAVGGSLSVRDFHTGSLAADSTLTIGGHVITRGVAPGFSPGPALSGADTASSSGNDASGTIAVNIGTGSSKSGIVGYVTFHSPYSSTPHVVVTPVGPGASDVYVNRSASGFSIGVSSISPGGHAFDYIVMQ